MAQAIVTDTFLINSAKAANSEAYRVASYLTVATAVVTDIATDATALEGEVGTRVALTGSRSGTVGTLSGIRSGVDVVDTANGDDLNSSGLSSYAVADTSTDDLFVGVITAGVTQTTNFDLEYIYNYEYVRKT